LATLFSSFVVITATPASAEKQRGKAKEKGKWDYKI